MAEYSVSILLPVSFCAGWAAAMHAHNSLPEDSSGEYENYWVFRFFWLFQFLGSSELLLIN